MALKHRRRRETAKKKSARPVPANFWVAAMGPPGRRASRRKSAPHGLPRRIVM
jgi:hypothetical protein